MSELSDTDADLIRRRRRAALRVGVFFGAAMFAFELVGRNGWMNWFPLLRLAAEGPVTLSWSLGAVLRQSIAGILFGYLMFRMIREPGALGGPKRG